MAIQFKNGQILFDGGQIAFDPNCCCDISTCCPDPAPDLMRIQLAGTGIYTDINVGSLKECEDNDSLCRELGPMAYDLELMALGGFTTPCTAINNFFNSPTVTGLPVLQWGLTLSSYCNLYVNRHLPGVVLGCEDAENDPIDFVLTLVMTSDVATGDCLFFSQLAWHNPAGGMKQICRRYEYTGGVGTFSNGSGAIDTAGGRDCTDPALGGYVMSINRNQSDETQPDEEQEWCYVCGVTSADHGILLIGEAP